MEIIRPCWPAPENVKAFSSCRTGGVSRAGFDTLNLATHVGDELSAVEQNRRILLSRQNLPAPPTWLNQVHSTRIIELPAETLAGAAEPITADAAFTSQANQLCTVMTADCLPLLFCNAAGTRVAAVHAGWRGLLNGIIANTVERLSQPEQLLVWLGPAIGPAKFEVGAEVKAAFVAKKAVFQQAFQMQANGKYLADIYLLARMILVQQGVSRIYGGEHCTVSEPAKFYSYRRDGQTGRMASLIWLQAER